MTKKGVNIGGWLVLEKWMTPYLFDGCEAEDELHLYEMLPLPILQERITLHRQSFICERDFQMIQAMGLDLVRLPIPYFLFGDYPPYMGCITYVDQAFAWAKKYQLQILLDLHTVPGGQNGLDNSGRKGICTWHTKKENIDASIQVIERLAQRYGKHPCLYGIEVINEPADEGFWKQGPCHFPSADTRLKAVSSFVPTDVLKSYYQDCYRYIEKYCEPWVRMVIHDGFRLQEFQDFMPKDAFPRLLIDLHLYLNFEYYGRKDIPLAEYIEILDKKYQAILHQASLYHDLMIGEWSLGSYLKKEEKENLDITNVLFQKQLAVYSQCAAWCFWSYKITASARMQWDYQVLHLALAEREIYEYDQ